MMCCAIAGLLMAVLAAWRGAIKRALTRLPRAGSLAVALVAVLVLTGGAALAARRLDYAARGQADLAAILMRHVCGERPATPARWVLAGSIRK